MAECMGLEASLRSDPSHPADFLDGGDQPDPALPDKPAVAPPRLRPPGYPPGYPTATRLSSIR
ncbi:MAG: hypothetical protein GYA33_05575 [Thermogutta sp.]|nr:hypothetical protein [Thermogutta sp.]